MPTHYRAVVIGGGVVGASVLYHLARAGWTECLLIERSELTAGSTWHAAAGFHTYNSDPTLARLQAYTIGLYPEIERESGQAVGLRLTGGVTLATTDEHWDWLREDYERMCATRGDLDLLDADAVVARCPIVARDGLRGGVFDRLEGRVDPHGTTHAYAAAARRRGAGVLLRTRVHGMEPVGGGWRVATAAGAITADHVVNAGGLWARRIARMTDTDIPVVPMAHHYLVTERIAGGETTLPNAADLATSCYVQQERDGALLGIYESNPEHWEPDGAPWDYGRDLLPPDVERIGEELTAALERFPAVRDAGIRRWVNGPFTFTPDGNPLVGPVPDRPGLWVACGCMAGFSQGGGIGQVLAHWMTNGEPDCDVAGMSATRFDTPGWTEASLHADTAHFYGHRFQMAAPRPLLVQYQGSVSSEPE